MFNSWLSFISLGKFLMTYFESNISSSLKIILWFLFVFISDDESDDDDEDDTEALMAELDQIKKERVEERLRKVSSQITVKNG